MIHIQEPTQKDAFERIYSEKGLDYFNFHDTRDPLTRYLRDRRLNISLKELLRITGPDIHNGKVLVVCDGVGGAGTFFANQGFGSVTVSDISPKALELCVQRDPRLKAMLLDVQDMTLEDGAFDLVVVQDGLHHLKRPFLGYTEMLRVAGKAVVVIEPHAGLVASIFGKVWEEHYGEVNYVFRWDRRDFIQVASSYMLRPPSSIKFIRLWDHNVVMNKVARFFGGTKAGLFTVKASYFILDHLLPGLGNMMIGVLIK